MSYNPDRHKWSNMHIARSIELLGRVFFRLATPIEDIQNATDLVFVCAEKRIAVRHRGMTKDFRQSGRYDFTIRSIGSPSEFEKFMGGKFADALFYGHIADDEIDPFVVLDLRVLAGIHSYGCLPFVDRNCPVRGGGRMHVLHLPSLPDQAFFGASRGFMEEIRNQKPIPFAKRRAGM